MSGQSRFFRLLLRLYPSGFRNRYGAEMEEIFCSNLAAAGSPLARCLGWLRGILDLLLRVPRGRRFSGLASPGGGWRGSSLGTELRQGSRRLLRHRWQSLLALIVVGLGISGAASSFALLQGIVLDPLPYQQSYRLVRVLFKRPQRSEAHDPFERIFQGAIVRASGLTGPVSLRQRRRIFLESGAAEEVSVQEVSGDIDSLLGVPPAVGVSMGTVREAGVILSYRFWRSRFGGDPDVLGRVVRLLDYASNSDRSYPVAGVMPEGFATELVPPGPDLWLSVELPPPVARTYRTSVAIARLAPGSSRESAEEELNQLLSGLVEADPNLAGSISVVPLQDAVVGKHGRLFWMLFGAVGCLLAICGLNFAGLLVASLRRRSSEIAIRRALGARSPRILLTLLAESVPLSLAGAFLGLLLTFWVLPLVLLLTPHTVPRLESVRISTGVVLFSLLAAFGVGVLAALLAFPWNSRLNALRSLSSGIVGSRLGRSRLAVVLVTTEMALAILLLFCGTLLTHSLLQIYLLDPGYRMERVLAFGFPQPLDRSQPDLLARQAHKGEVLERIESLPGVELAAVGPVPFRGGGSTDIASDQPEAAPLMVFVNDVSAEFHRVLSIPLLRGRYFEREDREDGAPVVIVNRSLANLFWPGQDPIGRKLTLNTRIPAWFTVVGMVQDVRRRRLDQAPEPEIYLPYLQTRNISSDSFVIKIDGDVKAVRSRIQQAISEWNPERTITGVSTLEELAGESLSERRFVVWLLNSFSSVSLLLAGAGLYSLMASLVVDRSREVGLRMALGAQAGDILRLFLRWGLTLTTIGLLVGLPVAQLSSRLLERWLFAEAQSGWLPFLMAGLMAAMVALAACLWPSWRASRLDPLQALRES